MRIFQQDRESPDSKWVDDPKCLRSLVNLPEDLIAQTIQMLKIADVEDHTRVAKRINGAISAYVQRKAFDEATDNRRDQRAKLMALAASVAQARADLSALDEVCEGNIAVQMAIQRTSLGPRVDGLAFLEEYASSVDRLAAAIDHTLRDHFPGGRVTRGPEPTSSLYLLIQDLCGIYEQFSGAEVTHTTYTRSSNYAGQPSSPAGQFILKWVRHVEPTIAATRVSTILTAQIHKPKEQAHRSSCIREHK